MGQEMTSSELKNLSAFVADTQYDDLPDEVVAHTKWLLRDSVGVLIAGKIAGIPCEHLQFSRCSFSISGVI